MKYNQKYPNTKETREFDLYEPEPGLVYHINKSKCQICNENTNWTDADFNISMCSEECRVVNWDNFLKKNKQED